MPIYEYACDKCDHEFEAEQRITDPPVKTCPECRGRKVRRLISRTSFVLKGSGWYSDLYSSKGARSEKDSGKGDDSGGAAKSSEPKSDSKADSKSDSGAGDSAKPKKKGPKAAA
jgi:putative FmdB family regulatory protein